MSKTDIRELRKLKGWTQQQLATEMMVSLSTIKRWEKGTTFPRTNDSYRLKQLLENMKERGND
jgi:transcriptional regulator with XRE-family HTH domain